MGVRAACDLAAGACVKWDSSAAAVLLAHAAEAVSRIDGAKGHADQHLASARLRDGGLSDLHSLGRVCGIECDDVHGLHSE